MRVVAATGNKGKVKEISEIFSGFGIEVISQEEAGIRTEVEETGKSFEENARLKALAVAQKCNDAVIADDSGLCVRALDGAPGLYSARYAGIEASDSDRIRKLLDALKDAEDRSAWFVSAVVFVYPDGKIVSAEGRTEGYITYEPKGEGGFGYDPVFFSDELNKTFSQATSEEKNSVSHRARALSALYEKIKKDL